MRGFELVGRRQLKFNSAAPMPDIDENDVLVEVKACTVCGRSDLVYYHYYGVRDHCAGGCFGHEIAGTIADVGRNVRNAKIGDRVFIRTPKTSGYAEYAVARDIAVGHLPDEIEFEHGAILQLLPLAVHATRGVQLGDHVLIVGQGPVGLMALQIARLRGAAKITVMDLDPWRLQTSKLFGADDVIVYEDALQIDGNFDVAIEAVGTPATANLCIDAVRQNGLVVFLGTHHIDTKVTFDLVTWEKKGLRVHSSAEPTDVARHWAMEQAQKLVDAGHIRLNQMLSHRMSLEELPHAIDHLSENSVLQPEGKASGNSGPPPETLKIAICP